jgi:hypothetical protein
MFFITASTRSFVTARIMAARAQLPHLKVFVDLSMNALCRLNFLDLLRDALCGLKGRNGFCCSFW